MHDQRCASHPASPMCSDEEGEEGGMDLATLQAMMLEVRLSQHLCLTVRSQ